VPQKSASGIFGSVKARLSGRADTFCNRFELKERPSDQKQDVFAFMAGNPTQLKRQRERDRQSYQREKEALRRQRRDERAQKPPGEPGVDPDIAGIVPGPQPIVEEEE
jgi:hypothetical protein